jgi:hypothetical protein
MKRRNNLSQREVEYSITTLSKIQKFTVTLGSVESRRSRVDEVLRGKNIASTKTLQTTNQDNKRFIVQGSLNLSNSYL